MKKTIIWDFDGVIINSNEIREIGFRNSLNGYHEDNIDSLIKFHRVNGGLSRYVKFKYFFENITKEEYSSKQIEDLAFTFSNIMKENLIKPKYLINSSVDFIKNYHNNFNFHIASGSDEKELNYLCTNLNIDSYFKSINGSPKNKPDIINEIIKLNKYNKDECLLIGDSINDYEAAEICNINFFSFNKDKKLSEIKTDEIVDWDLFVKSIIKNE